MADVIIARQCRHSLLRVIPGDLTRYEAQVAVTCANNRLAGREGLDAKMHTAAGEKLREKCIEISKAQRAKNMQPCPVGTAVTTSAFDLPHEHLIHVVGPDCRRPSQDEGRRELIRKSYEAMFEQVKALGTVETMVCPPLSMGIYAYPHREGARMTMEILLGWLDAEEDPGVKDFVLLVRDEKFVKNLKTVYRETEDQFPGVDCTRQHRKRRF
ncbi:MAG: macro domain-containing protein [Candidatus Thermoplasmatota archaeon]|nr:macro domain-containing protein [Candidatus Thermoplasmatota archaeon]MEC9090124.1 macro domain-containing protein [Candidatus Thermoplasmatota archaeon]MED5486367.1 macro domain-containing protein [Candidatus Thermoplasmatota archaeon]|tara:strand:- start:135 stop:773 length:639 start_codon:yes stop_codon:yes gene_type:complete